MMLSNPRNVLRAFEKTRARLSTADCRTELIEQKVAMRKTEIASVIYDARNEAEGNRFTKKECPLPYKSGHQRCTYPLALSTL
jgi:hypothetical protein